MQEVESFSLYSKLSKMWKWISRNLSHNRVSVEMNVLSYSYYWNNGCLQQRWVLAPTVFFIHINNLLSSRSNPVYSYDSIPYFTIQYHTRRKINVSCFFISISQIYTKLSFLDITKGPGLDFIPPIIQKQCCVWLALCFLFLVNP